MLTILDNQHTFKSNSPLSRTHLIKHRLYWKRKLKPTTEQLFPYHINLTFHLSNERDSIGRVWSLSTAISKRPRGGITRSFWWLVGNKQYLYFVILQHAIIVISFFVYLLCFLDTRDGLLCEDDLLISHLTGVMFQHYFLLLLWKQVMSNLFFIIVQWN